MAGPANGVLALWLDLAPESEEMLNEWFNREHHLERVSVPGFLSARRYLALAGEPRYFIFYRTRDIEVLTSPPYLERLNDPTPWTRRALPHFRDTSRSACRRLGGIGAGEGGAVATLRFGAQPGAGVEAGLRPWLLATALPGVHASPGLVSAELWQADAAASNLSTEERRLRGADDVIADWIVWLSGNRPEQVEAAQLTHLGAAAIEENGGTAPTVGLYRLLFALGG